MKTFKLPHSISCKEFSDVYFREGQQKGGGRSVKDKEFFPHERPALSQFLTSADLISQMES